MTSSPHTSLPHRRRAGFTLLEILLVISIIAMVAAVAISQLDVIGTREGARRDMTEVQIGQLSASVQRYYLDIGQLPTSLEDLVRDPGVENWRGPYERRLPTDQWGDPFTYSTSGNSFEIRSNAGGSDQGPISSDDL